MMNIRTDIKPALAFAWTPAVAIMALAGLTGAAIAQADPAEPTQTVDAGAPSIVAQNPIVAVPELREQNPVVDVIPQIGSTVVPELREQNPVVDVIPQIGSSAVPAFFDQNPVVPASPNIPVAAGTPDAHIDFMLVGGTAGVSEYLVTVGTFANGRHFDSDQCELNMTSNSPGAQFYASPRFDLGGRKSEEYLRPVPLTDGATYNLSVWCDREGELNVTPQRWPDNSGW